MVIRKPIASQHIETEALMRIVNFVLLLFMLLFIGVQYNDPDGALWMLIYLVPAWWAGCAALRPQWASVPVLRGALYLCLLLAAAGIIYFWPDTPGWWRQDVWWEVETAREGMGMMIVTAVLVFVLLSTARLSKAPHHS